MPVSPESEIGIAYGQGRTAADALAAPTTNPYSDATLLGKQQRASWFQGYYDAIRDQNIRILQSGLAFLIAGGFVVPPGAPISIGSGGGSISQQAEGTPDQTGFWTGALSNAILIAEEADKTFDFAHPAQVDPTLFIHSHNQNATQWLGLKHDGVNGVINTGTGMVTSVPTFLSSKVWVSAVGALGAGLESDASGGINFLNDVGFSARRIIFAINNASNFQLGATGPLGWSSAGAGAAASDTAIARLTAGVLRLTDGVAANTRGLVGGGTAVASAAALPAPTGRLFHVTGSVTITSITSTGFQNGAIVTMIFDAGVTVTHGGNIILAGAVNFVATANDTLTMGFDGVSWFEICRSVN